MYRRGQRIGLYKFCGEVGRGNFSKVKLAMHQLTHDKVAVKILDMKNMDTKALRMLANEISTLECVHHPNILRLFEVIESVEHVYLITEWIRGGELYSHIVQGGPIRETHAAPLFKQILFAVKHMHNLGFVHRDIKAENVLLLSEDRLKLADFGFSTQLVEGSEQKLDTFCGSPPYAAPELFADDHYVGAAVDIWALGILLYFMVVGNMPFRAPTISGLKTLILKGDYLLPSQISLPCFRLIQRILVNEPVQRPSIDDMLNSQFVLYPKLSADLMQHEINMHDYNQAMKSTGFLQRKLKPPPRTYSLRDRYEEITKKPPISLSTKKTEAVFAENFLHPIEKHIFADTEVVPPTTSAPKFSLFSCSKLRKRVSPMVIELNKPKLQSVWNIDLSTNSSMFKNYDAETGKMIMFPTDTNDTSEVSSLEFEARQLLEELGITSEMLRAGIKDGPRSDVIGAYRVMINRLQKQSWLARKHVQMAVQKMPQKPQKIKKRSCCLL